MKRMYLMKVMAAVAMGLVVTSCNKNDFGGRPEISKEDAMANAEMQLGVEIDPNQDWKMTAAATANVTVNETFGETYTVKVFSNNPLADETGYVLVKGDVKSGQTFKADFVYPSGISKLVVGITDSKGFTFYRVGAVENGVLNVVFGSNESAAPARRSQASPAVAEIVQPYDETWVATYCASATEPNSTNVEANSSALWYPNQGGHLQSLIYNNYYTGAGDDAKNYYLTNIKPYFDKCGNNIFSMSQDDQRACLELLKAYTEGLNFWGITLNTVYDFKITGTWNGEIRVAGSEGLTDNGVETHAERTVVVTGTWNITEDQRIGSKGLIVIANGGKINVAEGKSLNLVNQARLVVLPGGLLTGAGKVEVNNGNDAGLENFNGGTIDVAKFNNNFGKFYNYGKFLVNEYEGGAQESNFYNHALVNIHHFAAPSEGSTANARIFNGCQFYVQNNARIRNYEGVQGSSLIVDGELMFSSSMDGTSTPSYVGLEAGAYVQCNTLYNNGTSWSGPTDNGYAVVKIGQITYLNWEQEHPENGGYFENNIYVELVDGTNVPDGNGYHQTNPSDVDNYKVSIANYKFFNIVANAFNNGTTALKGNGHVTKVVSGNTEIIPADTDFGKGTKGCTPGYNGDVPEEKEENAIWSYAFEDTWKGDYDLNDVVLKAQEDGNNIVLKLVAAGATLDLNIRLYEYDVNGENGYGSSYQVLKYNDFEEIHEMLGVDHGTMVNTGGTTVNTNTVPTFTIAKSDKYQADKLRLAIYSQSQGEVRLSGSGDSPFGVIIPWDWKWPTERTNITKAYNKKDAPEAQTDQSFRTFAESAGSAGLWFKYPTGSVVNK